MEPVTGIVKQYQALVAEDPSQLEPALIEILTGPCFEKSDGNGHKDRPILLVIDDFERALETEKDYPYPVHPDFDQTIRAVISAFRRAAGTRSKLLFTCRHEFKLETEAGANLCERLYHLSLGSMAPHEGFKQIKAKSRQEGVSPETLDFGISSRIIKAAKGNPGLLDLLFRMYLDGKRQQDRDPENVGDHFRLLNDTLGEMEAYSESGEYPTQQDLLEFLQNLAIDRMLGSLRDGEKQLLRASTLFHRPVPVKILEMIAEQWGCNGGDPFGHRIFGLGLWSRFEDSGDQNATAAAVNPLAEARLDQLDIDEAQLLAAMIIEPFFQAWGGANGENRPLAADWELARLALMAGSAEIISHTAADALRYLVDQFQNKTAATFAVACITLLDNAGVKGSSDFYHQAGKILHSTGESNLASTCMEQALRLTTAPVEKDKSGENYDYAAMLLTQGRMKQQKGELNEALQLFEEAGQRLEALGDRRSRAVTLGDIARIKVSKGDVDEALTLHEEMLEVFASLGDRRERAVTLGDIARIKVDKGDVDEALKLHEEAMEVYASLGDRRSRAVTLGDIARIKVDKGDVDEALKLHEERLEVFASLGDRRERAVTLGYIARIKVSKGDVDEALKLHEEAMEVYASLGERRSRAVTLGDIARIKVSKGDVDEALKLHEEEMEVYASLGERRSRAVTLGDIARIKVSKGDVDEALKLHEEMLEVFASLGDRRSRAVTLGDIARIKVSKGDVDEALKLHEERLEVFASLGDRRSRAVTLGDIARIKVSKGDVDEALTLHEEMLEVFASLGDRRERAVTLGDIARIKVSKGDVDEALKLYEEALEVYYDLGDLDGVAKALWLMAKIDISRQEYQKAYERLSESYGILMKIGRLDGICFVGVDLGQILCMGGHLDDGLEILKRSRDGFIKLGQPQLVEQVEQLISGFEDQKK